MLKTAITKDGQTFIDEPIVVNPKHEAMVLHQEGRTTDDHAIREIARAMVAKALESPKPPQLCVILRDPVAALEQEVQAFLGAGATAKVRQPITIGYERVRLRWMAPDANGNLKPR